MPALSSPDALATPSPDAGLPDVLVLDEVLSVLRISRTTWFKAKRERHQLVPEIPGLPERYSRDAVLAFVHQQTAAPVPAPAPAPRQVLTRDERHRNRRLLHTQDSTRRTA